VLPVVFVALVGVLFLVIAVRVQRRAARLQPLRDRAELERVTFRCPVRAQVRFSRRGGFTYLKNGVGGVELRVHATVLVVELAGRLQRSGRRLGAEVVLETVSSRMIRRRVGWMGTRLGARDCIVISGQEPAGSYVQVAVAPGKDLDRAWSALERAGVLGEP
jgi:hypothetical protein